MHTNLTTSSAMKATLQALKHSYTSIVIKITVLGIK